MRLKHKIAAVCTASVLALVVGVSSTVAANNSNQTGLVNVSLGDVALLNNVNLALAANVAATVCNVTVPVAVLAQQVVGQSGDYTCNTSAGPLTVTQALNGPAGGSPSAGGNNSHQNGLVNVSLGDVNILNNVNAAVAANIAVTACNLTIPVAVLATQIIGQSGDYVCTTATGPLTVSQAQ
jgi:hypothetical protein